MKRIILLLFMGFATCHAQSTGGRPNRYHAPPRHVPYTMVDSSLKLQFLQLFRSSNSSSNSTSYTYLDPLTIYQINQLCGREDFFYGLAPRHLEATDILHGRFMAEPDPRAVYNLASGVLHSREINPHVWYTALSLTFFQRPDLNGYQLAYQVDVAPDLYLPNTHIQLALAKPNGDNTCVAYEGVEGVSAPRENLLWYFREDFMINQHHWYWHYYFPFNQTRHPDRRGEQFYFVHHQIMTRYNAERLSNGLDLVEPLNLTAGHNIGVGYKSDIIDMGSGLFFTDREKDTPLADLYHEQDRDFELNVTVKEVSDLYKLLVDHISQGFLLNNQNETVNVRNQGGINDFVNTAEAAEPLSVNPQLYTQIGVHNVMHILLGLSADPNFEKGLPVGVPDENKITLDPYQVSGGEWPLKWDGIKIRDLEVKAEGRRKNSLQTFWRFKRFPLEEGIDELIHKHEDKVRDICHKHLDHDRFKITLDVEVSSAFRSNSSRGMVRLFMAPRNNLRGRRNGMRATRDLMFQLDVFPVELKRGRNLITRNSYDSSLTKPWSRTLEELLEDPNNGGKPDFCGCGMPEHLYIPKGNTNGMEFDFFAMITDFDLDEVKDSVEDLKIPEPCNSPYLVCNIPYRKYPDKRAMGYPFDRLPYLWRGRQLRNLEEYVSNVPNMYSSTVVVQHVNRVLS